MSGITGPQILEAGISVLQAIVYECNRGAKMEHILAAIRAQGDFAQGMVERTTKWYVVHDQKVWGPFPSIDPALQFCEGKDGAFCSRIYPAA